MLMRCFRGVQQQHAWVLALVHATHCQVRIARQGNGMPRTIAVLSAPSL